MDEDTVVAVFANTVAAGQALERLRVGGIGPESISVVGRSFHVEERLSGYYSLGEGPRYVGRAQEFWSGLMTAARFQAFLWLPGIGPLVIAGPLVDPLMCRLTAEGADTNTTAFASALMDIGFVPTVARKYESAINGDMVLVMVRGQADAVGRAVAAMNRVPKLEMDVFDNTAQQG